MTRFRLTRPKKKIIYITLIILILLGSGGFWYWQKHKGPIKNSNNTTKTKKSITTGQITKTDIPQIFTLSEVKELVSQNYYSSVRPNYALLKQVIHYSSQDTTGKQLDVTAQVFLPEEMQAGTKVPIIAFASGTTGIGDQCAPSLEQPQIADWANYNSHLAAYASQGYAVIMTDYVGMGDSSQTQPYLVGEMEGRAVLDSIRAIQNLPASRGLVDTSQIFIMGYSQGGHAAFWSDKIASSYAPELKIKGIIGFNPVMSVTQTLADITKGANINWIGPFLLVGYGDYYKTTYPINRILLPRWQSNLTGNVNAHCIDSVNNFWGRSPSALYTAEFLQALRTNTLANFNANLANNLATNIAGDAKTATAKLIVRGALDNVILPAQENETYKRICSNSTGPFSMQTYATATHYNTMYQGFSSVVNWISQITKGGNVSNNCQS